MPQGGFSQRVWTGWLIMACLVMNLLATGVVRADELATAREHHQRGRYVEALEDWQALAKQRPDDESVLIGHTRTLRALGQAEEARRVLSEAIKADPDAADLQAELAELHWEAGRLKEAALAAEFAIEVEPDHLRARLILADAAAAFGQLKEAEEGYRWFVRYYNQAQPTEAEDLWLVGQGAARYARWKSVSQVFNFVLNTVCSDIEKADPLAWEGKCLGGSLLLEKYNRAQAIPELQAALAINPQAAEVLLQLGLAALEHKDYADAEARADAILATNANHAGAVRLKLDVALATDAEAAVAELLPRLLALNPADERNQARVAALELRSATIDRDRWQQLLEHLDHIRDWSAESPSKYEEVFVRVARQNPRPGVFLSEVAQLLEDWRKFTLAEELYRRAISLMPPLAQPKTGLGMLYLQTGRVEPARELLDAAFKADPYDVKVSNLRKVVRVLDEYEAITTPHFVIHADSKLDRLLARYMAEYLEEIYSELVAEYQFEPPQRTQIEIYNNAKGLSGHQWFSARMIGLPWIQTIGASTGMMIAMTSPTCLDQPLHWGRVLRHEFVHVLTLQQTEFNIPHWYTEALAMRAEGMPRPREWNRLLRERVAANNLRQLDTLTAGFVRAQSKEDWDFAYCQSALYADYMVERAGTESLRKLLEAYQRQLKTDVAIREVFGVEMDEFESGYRKFLDQVVAGLAAAEPTVTPQTPAEIRKAYEATPDDPEVAARYAALLWQTRKPKEACKLAEKVLEKLPGQPVAVMVLAQSALADDDRPAAIELLDKALKRDKPDLALLKSLLELQQAAENWSAVTRLAELGQQRWPGQPEWWKATAAAALEAGDLVRLKAALLALVPLEPDNPTIRLKLAELELDAGNAREAQTWARDSLLIDVLNADVHRILAETAARLDDRKRAILEYETALELKPGMADWSLALARLHVADGQPERARPLLTELLKADPQQAEAQRLLDQLPAER